MRSKAVERYAIFPYIAWTLILGFAFYTGHLALELTRTFDHLETQCAEQNVCVEWELQ